MNIKSSLAFFSAALICVVACVLVFWLNIKPSVALEQELRCGIEEHIHTDNCYEGDFLVCEKLSHSHDGNCYIVLLKDNNINEILRLINENETHSLEYMITDVMSTALNFNSNLNAAESQTVEASVLSQDAVAVLNNTISAQEDLPDIVLNENINNALTMQVGNTDAEREETSTNNTENTPIEIGALETGATMLSVGDEPSSSSFIYLHISLFFQYFQGFLRYGVLGFTPFLHHF